MVTEHNEESVVDILQTMRVLLRCFNDLLTWRTVCLVQCLPLGHDPLGGLLVHPVPEPVGFQSHNNVHSLAESRTCSKCEKNSSSSPGLENQLTEHTEHPCSRNKT